MDRHSDNKIFDVRIEHLSKLMTRIRYIKFFFIYMKFPVAKKGS